MWCMFLAAPGPRPAALAGGVRSGTAVRAFLGFGNLGNLGLPCCFPRGTFRTSRRHSAATIRVAGGATARPDAFISSRCTQGATSSTALSLLAFLGAGPGWAGPLEAPGVAVAWARGPVAGRTRVPVRQTQQGEDPEANPPPRALAKMPPLIFRGPCIFPAPHPVASHLLLSWLAVCLAHHTSSPGRPGLCSLLYKPSWSRARQHGSMGTRLGLSEL